MRKINSNKKLFFRTLYISSVICLCLTIGIVGTVKAYENTLATGFGEYKKAFEYKEGKLRILDFEIELFNLG